MKLTIITPVNAATEIVSDETESYAGRFLRSDTSLSFVSITEGYSSIESELHSLINGPAAYALIRQAEADGADGVFVNCFDDPAVYACRECMRIPVYGAYTPSVLTALGLAERVGVITTDVPGILSEERKARLMGVSERIGAIRCTDMSVTDLVSNKDALLASLVDVCREMYHKDRIGAVCLGCTGMAYAVDDLRVMLRERDCPVYVVEPIAAALTWLERTVILKQSNTFRGVHT